MRHVLPFVLLVAACAPTYKFTPTKDGSPMAPIIVDPRPDAVITDVRPPIGWALAPGTDGAEIDFCRDEHCLRIATTYRARGKRSAPPNDMRSGVYWLRAHGVAGERVGTPGPTQKVALELRTKLETPHFILEGPREGRAALERLGTVAEKLLAYLSSYLAVPAPDQKMHVSFYATNEGYDFVHRTLDDNKSGTHTLGMSTRGNSFIRWLGRPARAIVDGPGLLEYTMAHELVHQLQQRWTRRYHDQPGWLIEGAADLLGEQALSSVYPAQTAAIAQLMNRQAEAALALERGEPLPLAPFVEADVKTWQATQSRTQSLFYSVGYSLLRSVSDPPDRLRAFFREILDYDAEAGFRIHRKIRSTFGDVAQLSTGLDRWLKAAPRRVVEPLWVDVRMLAGGAYHLEVAQGRAGWLLGSKHGQKAHIEAELEPAEDAEGCELLLGYQKPTELVRVRFSPKTLTITFVNGGDRILTQRKLEQPWTKRRKIALDVDGRELSVKIDDTEVATTQLPYPVEGRSGVGVTGGQLVVHSL